MVVVVRQRPTPADGDEPRVADLWQDHARSLARGPGLPGRSPHRRQVDHEPGAALGPVRDRDAAAVTVDDPGGDRETEAGPAPGRTRRAVEPLEHVGEILG